MFRKNDVELNVLQEHFLAIGMAKVATSAYEAYDFSILQGYCFSPSQNRPISATPPFTKLLIGKVALLF